MRKYFQKYKQLPIPVKASLWFLMCSFFQKGLSTLTTPIFTRILSQAEYGQYSVFNSWMSIITPIVCLNLFSGVYSQGLVKFEEDRKRFSSSMQGLCLTLISIWTVIYLLGQKFWNAIFSINTLQGVAMLLMIWATSTFTFWSMSQRVDFKYKKLVFITAAVAVVQPIVCVFLILHSKNRVTARILGIVAVQMLFYSGTFVSQMVQGKQFYSKKYWIYALKFNLPLIPHYLSMYILSSSDRIMISNMVGNEQAGIYNLAHSVALIMTLFNTALLQTIEPWIYRKLKANRAGDIANVAYPCFVGVAIVNIMLIIFAPELIAFFAPAEYHEAIWVIPGLALSVFFMFSYAFFAAFEFYYGKTKQIALATTGGALLNIVLNYAFIRIFGYIAAGYTTLICYMAYALFHYISMRAICKKYLDNKQPYSIRIYSLIAICFIAVGLIFLMTYNTPIIRFSLTAAIVMMLLINHKIIISKIKEIISLRKTN